MGTEFNIRAQIGSIVYHGTPKEIVSIKTATTGLWQILDMGVIQGQGLLPLDPPLTANPTDTRFVIRIETPASATASVDAVLLMPVDEHMIAESNNDWSPATINTYIDGRYKYIIDDADGYAMKRLGTLWEVAPGSTMTRYRWLVEPSTPAHKPTHAAAIELSIWPRTRHLLGDG